MNINRIVRAPRNGSDWPISRRTAVWRRQCRTRSHQRHNANQVSVVDGADKQEGQIDVPIALDRVETAPRDGNLRVAAAPFGMGCIN